MYLLVELQELRDLIEIILRKEYPDTPIEAFKGDAKCFESISEILDEYLNPDPETISPLLEDDEVLEKVDNLVNFILRCVILRGAIRWFKVIDVDGGLAISIKPGEDPCSLRPISVRLHPSRPIQPVCSRALTPE